MKIKIEIPSFVPPERIIHIVAGMERIGFIEPHSRKVFVKTSRCSRCGDCCKKLECKDLLPNGSCGRGDFIPLMCCTSEGRMKSCTAKYRPI